MKHPDYVAIKKPGASKSKKSMANQNDTTKPKAPAELSSSELFGRVRELEQECKEILRCLIDHGQMVAANE